MQENNFFLSQGFMYSKTTSNYVPEDYLEFLVLCFVSQALRSWVCATTPCSLLVFQAVPVASANKEVFHTCVFTPMYTKINDL